MVIMLKRRVAKAFAKPSVHTSNAAWWVHAIMQFHSFPNCGLEWFPWWRLFGCFPGCKFILSAASPLDLDWSCFWSCPSQTVWQRTWLSHRYVSARHVAGVAAGCPVRTPIASSSIALPLESLELNDTWKLFSPWSLYRKHLARNLFRVCCIQLGQIQGQRIHPHSQGNQEW